jgi:hypothetical protein
MSSIARRRRLTDLDAPRRVLAHRDAAIARFRKRRYPTPWSKRAIGWPALALLVGLELVAITCGRLALALHSTDLRSLARIGIELVVPLVATTLLLIRIVEQSSVAWRFVGDRPARAEVESRIDERALRWLGQTNAGARRLEAARLTRLLGALVTARRIVLIVAASTIAWYTTRGVQSLPLSLLAALLAAAWTTLGIAAAALFALYFGVQDEDGFLRRKLEMLAATLDEDPRALQLPRVGWLPKFN